MKRLILLVLVMVPFLCSAQTKSGLYLLDKNKKEIKVDLKKFDYTSTFNFTTSLEQKADDKTTVVMRSEKRKEKAYWLKGKKSDNRFKREVSFRVYIEEDSPYTIDDYYFGAFDIKDKNRYVTKDLGSDADIYPKSAKHMDPQGHVWKIEENVYEINLGGIAGEYYVLLIDRATGEYIGVYDFRLK